MRDNYDIEKLNPRRNPYAKMLKQQITININNDTIAPQLYASEYKAFSSAPHI